MVYSREEIQEMLDALPAKEWRFDMIKEDAITKTGALRTKNGQNIVEPGPEAASMIIGLRASIDFIEAAPQIVQYLLDLLDDKVEPPVNI